MQSRTIQFHWYTLDYFGLHKLYKIRTTQIASWTSVWLLYKTKNMRFLNIKTLFLCKTSQFWLVQAPAMPLRKEDWAQKWGWAMIWGCLHSNYERSRVGLLSYRLNFSWRGVWHAIINALSSRDPQSSPSLKEIMR